MPPWLREHTNFCSVWFLVPMLGVSQLPVWIQWPLLDCTCYIQTYKHINICWVSPILKLPRESQHLPMSQHFILVPIRHPVFKEVTHLQGKQLSDAWKFWYFLLWCCSDSFWLFGCMVIPGFAFTSKRTQVSLGTVCGTTVPNIGCTLHCASGMTSQDQWSQTL